MQLQYFDGYCNLYLQPGGAVSQSKMSLFWIYYYSLQAVGMKIQELSKYSATKIYIRIKSIQDT